MHTLKKRILFIINPKAGRTAIKNDLFEIIKNNKLTLLLKSELEKYEHLIILKSFNKNRS